jgi:hypothetical protein
MSQQLISRSPDLRRLQEEGYAVEVRANHLLLTDVPYVTSNREVARGTLVSELTLAGETTAKPNTHVAMFIGEMPCDSAGHQITGTAISSGPKDLGNGLVVDFEFSRKPPEGYADYYHKMTTYVALISGPAQAVDPQTTARTYRVIEGQETETVFHYAENASSRAGIANVTEKLECGPVAIVGLGGTGSYILDLVAKTPVKEIHLFDGDQLLQHNAFRAPGAPSLDTLREVPGKAVHYRDTYSEMRRNIFAHGHVTEDTAHDLQGMDFVFVAVDHGPSRELVVDKLQEFRIPFIDVGMGILEAEGSLLGQLRVTLWDPRTGGDTAPNIPYGDGVDNEYSRNIQIADLNALNAALAVLKWKKFRGFYLDIQNEYQSYYQIDGNCLINETEP